MKATTNALMLVRAAIFMALLLGWTGCVSAVPQIVSQPQMLAVDLGEAATFTVNADVSRGVTYQWQHNGINIPGATEATLTIDEVTQSNLGIYTVIVSGPTGQVTSQPAALKLARWRELIYFGSSEGMSQFSNGPSWVDRLAERFGIQPTHYRNYAVGSASNADVASQISNYLSANQPTERTLLVFWTGGPGDELSWGSSVDQSLAGHVANIQTLIDAGGHNFLIPTIWPVDVTPLFRTSFPNLTVDLTDEFDRALDEKLQEFEQAYGITVFRPDMFQFFREIWASPESYGFLNLDNSAQSSSGSDDVFFWWDGVHFTRAAHQVISLEIYRQLIIKEPADVMDSFVQAWLEHDSEFMGSLFTADGEYVEVATGNVYKGPHGVMQYASLTFSGAPDFALETTTVVNAGNHAFWEWVMSGTHTGYWTGLPATGRKFSVPGVSIIEMEGTRIQRASDYWDLYTLLQQLGAISFP